MSVDYELRAARMRQAALAGGEHVVAARKQQAETLATLRRIKAGYRSVRPVINYGTLALKISEVVGNCVPDGNPSDHINPYLERLGIDVWKDGLRHLNKACKLMGYKTYDAYLIGMWDLYNEMVDEEQQVENPWRPA